MNTLKKISALLCILCVCVTGCTGRSDMPARNETASQQTAVQPDPNKSAQPEREIISTVTLLAAGDNLIHDVLYQQARARTTDGSYDFKPLYERVKKQIAAADIAMINQETPIVKDRAPSSYPRFNTPYEMTANLRDVGFDVLNISNNHMLDQGADGLAATAAQIRATDGLTSMGAYEMPEQRNETIIVEKNGVRFAFLGFTQYTNGLVFPEGREFMAVYTDDAAEMRRQIERARQNADVVVVSVHWGVEDTGVPTAEQQRMARNLADYGADMIVGTHPHVLQPVEIVENAQGKKIPVIYSLGNFVSSQNKPANMIGAMAEITVEKNQTTGKVTVGRPEITPTVTHYGAGMRNVLIYPLSEYSDEMARSHGVRLDRGKPFSRAYIDTTIAKVIAPGYIVPNVRDSIANAALSDAQKPNPQKSGNPVAANSTPENMQNTSSSASSVPQQEEQQPLQPKKQKTDSESVASKKPVASSKASEDSSGEKRLLPERSDDAA